MEAINFMEEAPADFSRESYRSVGMVQAESLRFGEPFHWDKNAVFSPYLRDAIKSDRIVEGCSLWFQEDGYLFRIVRPSYLSIQLYVFEFKGYPDENEQMCRTIARSEGL